MLRILFNILWIIFGGGFIIWLSTFLLADSLYYRHRHSVRSTVFQSRGHRVVAFRKEHRARPEWPLFWNPRQHPLVSVRGDMDLLSHVSLAVALAVTIIGIPFAVQHIKLALLALWPLARVARF